MYMTMACVQQIYLDLAEGVKIPALGLGTWQALDEEGEKAIDSALEAGYRHIDTAYVYQNEKAVGRALKKWLDSGRIKREDLFVVTKAMEDQVVAGKARSIGLSNFNEKQIERVWNSAEHIKPSMLQIELHLYLQQKELVEYCKSKNIKVCAYSPFGSPGAYKVLGKESPDVLNNETVKEIAEKHGKTPAQILLRHIIQRGIAVIPKSSNPKRIQENIQVFDFELNLEDVHRLDAQDQGKAERVFDFSMFKGATTHPEYPF